MGWEVTSVARRSVRTSGGLYDSGAAAARREDRVDNTRNEAGGGVQMRPPLPRSGAATRLGAILAEPAGMASAK